MKCMNLNRKKKPEQILTEQVSRFMQMQFPNVIFKFDLASDQKLTIQQASRNSNLHGKWSRGSPDLTIFEKRGEYGALFLELKAEGKSPFKKNGELKKNDHLETQDKYHQELRKRGYKVEFSTGFDETILKIRAYLRLT